MVSFAFQVQPRLTVCKVYVFLIICMNIVTTCVDTILISCFFLFFYTARSNTAGTFKIDLLSWVNLELQYDEQ